MLWNLNEHPNEHPHDNSYHRPSLSGRRPGGSRFAHVYFLESDAAFTVVAQLPALGSDFQYRIKSIGEPYERMVLEHQLTRASPRDAAVRGFFKDRDVQTT
jgi:hypothetical protein